jgi:nitrogen fixation NifU-like protein
MYSEALLDHFQNPRNVGELPAPAVTAEVMNPACGDIMRLSVLFEAGVLASVGYKTRGCTASIAAGSALTEIIKGRKRNDLQGITAKAIEDALGGLAPESRHAAVLAIDALKAVLRSEMK